MTTMDVGLEARPPRAAGQDAGVARTRPARRLALLGPAFVAAVAYVDPGNFATNITAGARHGYALVWVIVFANLMAMLVQYLAAKVGVVTGLDLPELCREHFSRAVVAGLWIQAELVAIATDVAELVGAAVGLGLLVGVPLLPAGLASAVAALGLLALQRRGYRRFELAVAGFLGLVLLGLGYDLVQGHVAPGAALHGLVPALDGPDSVLLAAGIVGATVMPHAVYLHSGLTKTRAADAGEHGRRALLRFQRVDVVAGLTGAGLTNLVIILLAAGLFHTPGGPEVSSLKSAHSELARLAGGAGALCFAAALFASGIASSSVGTYAGQVVMQGFVRRRIPLWSRRAATALPALAVLALGLPTTTVLLLSQVVLSFGIPFALVPMILLTRRRDVMGVHVNRPLTTAAALAVAAVIILLNVYLLWSVVGPGAPLTGQP